MEKGYVHVYTGNGKGKTTTMLGLALRASGVDLRIYIGQFIKDGEYSEVTAINKFLPTVEIEQYGTGFIIDKIPTPQEISAAKNGLTKATEAMNSNKYDIIMLDEINVAIALGLLDVTEVMNLIQAKPENLELVLTGRNAHKDIVAASDLVSEIVEIKHYYNAGVMARIGIEK